jgi:hypothetical protein
MPELKEGGKWQGHCWSGREPKRLGEKGDKGSTKETGFGVCRK